MPSFGDWFALITGIVYLFALVSVPSVLLQRQGRPQAAMGWLLVLLFLPGLGVLLWWAIGRRHLLRRRIRRRMATVERSGRLANLQDELPSPPEARWDLMPIHRLPDDLAEWCYAPTQDNQIELLVDVAEAYSAMEEAIRSAKQHIHLMFYIWRADSTGARFRDLLIEKAREGVEVRVLLDGVGGKEAAGRFMDPLRAAGGQVAVFMAPRILKFRLDLNFRNHRKILVTDSATAIVGGFNIGDEYGAAWCDIGVRIRGPAVDQLQDVFADDWHFTTGDDFIHTGYFGGWREHGGATQEASASKPSISPAVCSIVASGPHTTFNITHESLFMALCHAEGRIWIATPYFIPNQAIETALRTAVFRGVDVRVLIPARGDHRIVDLASRSYQPELLRSGARIFHHHGGFLHTKTIVIDDDLSIVGSANVDIRSFRLNFEVNCYVKCPVLANDLALLYKHYLRESRELTIAQIEQTPRPIRLAQAVAHLFSPLL